jgi:hypothetical protein
MTVANGRGESPTERILSVTSSLPSPSICHRERERESARENPRRISPIELCLLVIKCTAIPCRRLVFVYNSSRVRCTTMTLYVTVAADDVQLNSMTVVLLTREREKENALIMSSTSDQSRSSRKINKPYGSRWGHIIGIVANFEKKTSSLRLVKRRSMCGNRHLFFLIPSSSLVLRVFLICSHRFDRNENKIDLHLIRLTTSIWVQCVTRVPLT